MAELPPPMTATFLPRDFSPLSPFFFIGIEIPQEFDAAVNILQVFTGHAHLLALVGAGGEIDIIKVFFQFGKGDILADAGIADGFPRPGP